MIEHGAFFHAYTQSNFNYSDCDDDLFIADLALCSYVGLLSWWIIAHNHHCIISTIIERCQFLIAYYLFFDIASGPQAILSFSKLFKHQTTIIFDGDSYIHFEMDKTGILYRRLAVTNSESLMRAIWIEKHLVAIITVDISKRKKVRWYPYIIRSCNEIARYLTGIDLGLTLNPKHFYRKILKYDKQRNYEILYHKERDRSA